MANAYYKAKSETASDAERDGKMGFLEHLDELRTRLIRSCLAIGTGMAVAFVFVDRIADFVLAPAVLALPAGSSLIMTRPGEGLSFQLDLAMLGGVILAAPFVTYQIWRFIAPGLYAREKRLIIPFLLLTTVGTLAGALFSHYLLFPSMMAFFQRFDSPHMRFMPRVEDTFELYKNVLLGMVAVFQIPTLVFFLARMRLVTAGFLWRHLQFAVLIGFIAAAALTPSPDPWNQALFAAPMIALYVISIGIAWIVAPRQKDRSAHDNPSPHLRLVFAATVIDSAIRHGRVPQRFQLAKRVRPYDLI